jgi:hypothetical protein
MMLGRQLLSNIPCAEWFKQTILVIGPVVVDATPVNSGVMTLWTFNGNIQDGWTTVKAQQQLLKLSSEAEGGVWGQVYEEMENNGEFLSLTGVWLRRAWRRCFLRATAAIYAPEESGLDGMDYTTWPAGLFHIGR